jgi:3',5'-cyclic AMP phosphodiesterase CpdA
MRILQLTDTHFGSDDLDSQVQDKRTFKSIQRLVVRHQPDFLIHTGDFINNDQGAGVSFEAIDVLDGLGLPWTHALGNHDIGGEPVDAFRKRMKRAAVGEFRDGNQSQYAFRLDIVHPGKTDPAYSVFCFDSGYQEPDRRVTQPQLAWFRRHMQQDVEQGVKTPALAMIHIPVVEFDKLQSAKKHSGNFGERVCFDNDTGDTFAAFQQSRRVKGVFSGHDHKNDYTGLWEGVELVYGRVGGWSAYGDLPRGGRLIEVDLAAQNYSHKLVFPDA